MDLRLSYAALRCAVQALRLVRRFKGHTDRISDLQLSSDCRWLLSASMDNTVRVWDVPGATAPGSKVETESGSRRQLAAGFRSRHFEPLLPEPLVVPVAITSSMAAPAASWTASAASFPTCAVNPTAWWM